MTTSQRCRSIVTAAMAALVLSVAGFGSGADGGMTPKQLAQLRSMVLAEISPDGAHIAVVRSVPRTLFDQENGASWAELHVIDTTTGTVHPFVTGEVNVSGVQWLPDGTAISFLAERNGDDHTCLYSIPVAGGEAQRIVAFGSDILSYSWNPDGNRVAFIATVPPEDHQEELEEAGFTQEVYEEDWRPRAVWIVPINGDSTEPTRLPVDGSAFQARWSPAGDRLALALAPRPLVDDEYMRQQVNVVSVASGHVEGVVDHAGKLGRFAWSPDGRKLAMIAGINVHDPAESSLFVADAGGGTPINLTRNFAGHVNRIAWKDPSTVAFLGDVGTATDLFIVPADGGASPAPMKLAGAPVFTSFTLAKDGSRAALVGESAAHPGEVFTWDLGSAPPRRLTDSNPWLAGVPLGKQELVRFAARDGLELEGILIQPLDREPGSRVPLVLVVHGGPESHYRNGWMSRYSRPAQIFAARGFAVFYPNYRGSTGRGAEFSLTSQADPAGAEFDDLVDAVDHLVSIGLVDRARVGVTGGSYGGYATAWCATRFSDRFAAGVMFVGISNKLSKIGTTDIPDEEFYVHARTRVYDDVPFFLERSPISYVKQAHTPLLIMHGEDDPRVSVTQSKELYRALKIVGDTPVRLVLYPGEGHGNRKAAARYDLMLRLLRWMEHYVMESGENLPPYQLDYRLDDDGW